jgi:hypothetical protein
VLIDGYALTATIKRSWHVSLTPSVGNMLDLKFQPVASLFHFARNETAMTLRGVPLETQKANSPRRRKRNQLVDPLNLPLHYHIVPFDVFPPTPAVSKSFSQSFWCAQIDHVSVFNPRILQS